MVTVFQVQTKNNFIFDNNFIFLINPKSKLRNIKLFFILKKEVSNQTKKYS